MEHDVIVTGAGPAGSVTAALVAQAGFYVLVLEKNTSCKSPCAGYISNNINLEIPDDSVVQSRITKMRTYFPDLSFHDFELNGFVVDRSSFDMLLAGKAIEEGASIRWGSPLQEIVPGGVKFRNGMAHGKIIVGADGVFSKTASLLGFERQKFAVCAQYHLKGIKPLSQTCEIFFSQEFAPGGYVWIYPTGKDSAKVGVGVTHGYPRAYLEKFISESSLSERLNGIRIEYIAGALPIGGLREKLCCGNVLLAGDSAGMADPVTGAGINNAMLAGEIAGKSIIKALESNDMEILSEDETKIRRLLGKPFARALEKRKMLDVCYASNELLQENLPELWMTFRQYWEI
ncbi:MAG: NAD(P)/FAD-dependent oxidoreductase [Candidatus Methanoperedens sp.]|nr:NAD(P)/FAD-dependent oxidoreductase [Candidatus Methanoperedens sp.]